jgi:polysaccharide biosynthesis protein PslH
MSPKQMRVLWVKSGGLLPLDAGGKIRSFNIARELANRHEVTLFTFYPRTDPDPNNALGEPFAHVERECFDLPERGSARDTLNYAVNALTSTPYQIRKYCRPQVSQRLLELLRHKKYDVILCDYLVTAGVLPWNTGIPVVIFTHNVEAVIWQRHFLRNKNLLWKAAAWREYRTIARAERHFATCADHVLTVSDEDRRYFLDFLPREKVTTVPTGVDLEYFQPAGVNGQPSLVFTGSMDWMPNEDAITYFAAEVLPLIQQYIPNVTLSVVGKNPTRKLLALAKRNDAIRVTGAVSDIRPYVAAASVYIVPIRIGSGTRIKIFEAMAMAKAVVSTTIGAEGLPVQHGKNILLADTPQDFAARTVELLKQRSTQQRIGLAARTLVESRYAWTAVTDVVENALLPASLPIAPTVGAR